jgi:hypothetical protein
MLASCSYAILDAVERENPHYKKFHIHQRKEHFMKINKTIAIAVLLFGLLIGGLVGGGIIFSQNMPDVNAAPPAQEPSGDEANEADEADEADETEETVSPDQAAITADEAKAAAEAAYPGAKAREVELENEGGQIAYEVELDNGIEVLVDPADGSVLGAGR